MKHSRTSRIGVTAAVAALALLPGTAAVATAASPGAATPAGATSAEVTSTGAVAAPKGSGWLRLGHLSPDTKSVDVSVSALSGGSTVFELDGVGYGDVSGYESLPTGSYTVSMVPAGASSSSVPVISETVRISAKEATTVAAYGSSDDLKVRTFADDLTEPGADKARIRLIQASTTTPEVDVMTSTGQAIVEGAQAGSATRYAEIDAGDWSLELTGGDVRDTADVTVRPGSVTTLFVLDTADGGLTVQPVLDSSSVGDVPEGGVDTGGGFLTGDSLAALPFASWVRTVPGPVMT
ncbi:DUF4397 domain-containing protein [Promicromonospora sukumoe]|uniref:DUF4397 domain-containing protein n=1 Tax=Promicromonospora sukumoe TaxID=88382 RepID=A0A7W3PFS8_9MICO|nr:DUF4397 domain-containing protein [Promicromonospora sukumoe]MBA8810238.1 hypothetical protein [Promicromonospora sukumoe]